MTHITAIIFDKEFMNFRPDMQSSLQIEMGKKYQIFTKITAQKIIKK